MLLSIFIFFATIGFLGCAGALTCVVRHWRLRKKLQLEDPYKFAPNQLRLDELGFQISNFLIVMAVGALGLIILIGYIIFRFLA